MQEIDPVYQWIAGDGFFGALAIMFWMFKYFIRRAEITNQKYADLVADNTKQYVDCVADTNKQYALLTQKTMEDHNKVVDKFTTLVEKTMSQNNYTDGMLIKVENSLENVIKGIDELKRDSLNLLKDGIENMKRDSLNAIQVEINKIKDME
jgi:hypothetical protein